MVYVNHGNDTFDGGRPLLEDLFPISSTVIIFTGDDFPTRCPPPSLVRFSSSLFG
jgi:hypothetical protein